MRGAKKLCFEAFDRGERPSDVHIDGIKETTKYRYYQEWKKRGGRPPSPRGAPISSEVGPAAGDGSPDTGSAVARFEAFKARQELEADKEKVRKQVGELLETLEEAQGMYEESGVSIKGWEEKRERLEGQLRDFLLAELERVNSEEELNALAQVLDRVDSDIVALWGGYEEKLAEQERLRQQREQEVSRRLLQERLDLGPLVPSWLAAAIADRLVVRNKAEAEMVSQAVSSYTAVHLGVLVKPENRDRVWQEFLGCLDQEPWKFIRELAATHYLSGYPSPPSYFPSGLTPV